MRKFWGFVVLLLASSVPALAQTPVGELGIGYSFQSWNVPPVLQPNTTLHMNGLDVSAEFNLNGFLGVDADAGWTRNTQSGATTNITTVMLGPQIYPIGHHRITPFAHALFGIGSFNLGFPSSSSCTPYCNNRDGNFAWAGGGGLDINISRHFAIRPVELDYEQTQFDLQYLTGAPAAANQNSWKYTAAILFHFGRR